MAVSWIWSGSATADGFTVRAMTDADNARVAVSASAGMTSPAYFNATIDPQGVATAVVTGRASHTRYWFAIEEDGEIDATMPGRTRTAPEPGPASFRFASGACAEWDGAAFHRILREDPDFFVHTGDFTYREEDSSELQPHRDVFNDVLGGYRWQGLLHRQVGTVLLPDDHDFGENDSDKTSPGRAQYQEVFREVVPAYTLPATVDGGVWHSFTWGRLRMICTDLRTERDPKTDEDTADKRMMGVEQEAWFRAECLDAQASGQAICWVNTIPWIGTTHPYGDRWGSYTTHRQELADFFDANALGDIMFIVSGDAHLLAIDDGANNQWGGFPVFQFAALNSGGFTQGGPYTWGPLPGLDQYGTIDVRDPGGDTMTVIGRCVSKGTAVGTLTFSITLPSAPQPHTPGPRVAATGGARLTTVDGRQIRA